MAAKDLICGEAVTRRVWGHDPPKFYNFACPRNAFSAISARNIILQKTNREGKGDIRTFLKRKFTNGIKI